jgi:hypothetical protein
VIGLGTVWILDGLEVTIVGSMSDALKPASTGLGLTRRSAGRRPRLSPTGDNPEEERADADATAEGEHREPTRPAGVPRDGSDRAGVEQQGPQQLEDLSVLVGAGYWEAGRFDRAMAFAARDGLVVEGPDDRWQAV